MVKAKSKGATFEDFESLFRTKNFGPLYLFFGEENLLIDETVELLVEHALDETTRSFNLNIVYGGEVTGADIVAMASSFPMTGERRVVVVREFDKVLNKDILLSYLEHPSLSTSLVLVSVKPDFRNKVFKILKDDATVGEFRQLYESEVPEWVSKRAQRMGKKITPDAAQLVHAYVGRSLREIHNEIEKLCIYVGQKPIIDAGDVSSVVGLSRQFNIFELQKAVGQQQLPRAVEILENMLRSGESPIGIVVMMARYFQKLWLVQELLSQKQSEYQLSAAVGVSPVFIKEYMSAARRYSSLQLRQCFIRLTEADEALKSSVMDQRTIMTLLLYGLIRTEEAIPSLYPQR
ncbi:MAG: DNA polymerase III subunit delta [Ignavibacteriae bacterium]|nr:DNA polymerase III subunit delta [Ignavibacteria bacterium]MBI3365247.1 DNA polymerase III subunit delta [Ignavibacteriota bacterium]